MVTLTQTVQHNFSQNCGKAGFDYVVVADLQLLWPVPEEPECLIYIKKACRVISPNRLVFLYKNYIKSPNYIAIFLTKSSNLYIITYTKSFWL